MARISTQLLCDWLKPQLLTITGYDKLGPTAGRPTDKPDRQIGIQRVGGPRVVMNGSFEEVMFRFEYRGGTNSIIDAETIAIAMDSFLWGRNNFDVGDAYVTSVDYGSPLRQLPASDNSSRFTFTADYKFVAARED